MALAFLVALVAMPGGKVEEGAVAGPRGRGRPNRARRQADAGTFGRVICRPCRLSLWIAALTLLLARDGGLGVAAPAARRAR